MASTVWLLAAMLASLALSLSLAALLLKLGAWWAKAPQLSLKRAMAIALLMALANLTVVGVVYLGQMAMRLPPYAAVALQLVACALAQWKVVQWMLGVTFLRAVQAWLPTLLGVPVAFALSLGVLRPFVGEGFMIPPTNAMAPTLLGRHYRATCPLCGGCGIVSATDYSLPTEEDLGICRQCMRASKMRPVSQGVYQGDRILVMKPFTPRRWDLIVFRVPEDPSAYYVMRLVGLPGEEVNIKDGDVWIDGKRLEKPVAIRGLVYWGDPGVPGGRMDPDDQLAPSDAGGPWRLGPDEHFVLGDFSLRSNDSRVWPQGAPGHPPYAVPREHIVGVVTHVFWPPTRWHVLR